MKHITLFLLSVFTLLAANAQLRPSNLIGDNMVLQQNADARIFGTADPSSKITITTSWGAPDSVYTTYADRTGEWCTAVRTPAGSFTPQTVTITDGTDTKVCRNVLIGEVWLASGQSNMEMPLKGFGGCCLDGGFEEIANSRQMDGRIRFFNVPKKQSYEPQDTVAGRWTLPSPQTAPDYSACAWFFAKRLSSVLDIPVGIVSAAYGGAKVESWTPRDMVEKYPDVSLDKAVIDKMIHYHRPMLMYNAMFNPIKDYTYQGVIWYQGCSNVGLADTFIDRFPAMITRWREEIGLGDIPFYTVEIAPYIYGDQNQPSQAALLREAQHKAVERVPNAGIVCINDLVKPFERHNIHPANKKGVGDRLADLALNRTYGQKQFLWESPRYKSHEFKNGAAVVAIHAPSMGINRNCDIEGFELAGADKVFYPADDVTLDWRTNSFVVKSSKVAEPVAVRYCWGDFVLGNVYSGNYLPLLPFRTDNW